jgi:hypothetical protein
MLFSLRQAPVNGLMLFLNTPSWRALTGKSESAKQAWWEACGTTLGVGIGVMLHCAWLCYRDRTYTHDLNGIRT